MGVWERQTQVMAVNWDRSGEKGLKLRSVGKLCAWSERSAQGWVERNGVGVNPACAPERPEKSSLYQGSVSGSC